MYLKEGLRARASLDNSNGLGSSVMSTGCCVEVGGTAGIRAVSNEPDFST